MIIGLGVDVFEVSRMERALRDGDSGFPRDLFTPQEIAACERQPNPPRQFAALFALKEAILKALSVCEDSGAAWLEVELNLDADGAATASLHGGLEALARRRRVGRVLVSLSHAPGLAIARAVLESDHD